jgi:hypothetical protein
VEAVEAKEVKEMISRAAIGFLVQAVQYERIQVKQNDGGEFSMLKF